MQDAMTSRKFWSSCTVGPTVVGGAEFLDVSESLDHRPRQPVLERIVVWIVQAAEPEHFLDRHGRRLRQIGGADGDVGAQAVVVVA
jgi:hypothetical protein